MAYSTKLVYWNVRKQQLIFCHWFDDGDADVCHWHHLGVHRVKRWRKKPGRVSNLIPIEFERKMLNFVIEIAFQIRLYYVYQLEIFQNACGLCTHTHTRFEYIRREMGNGIERNNPLNVLCEL